MGWLHFNKHQRQSSARMHTSGSEAAPQQPKQDPYQRTSPAWPHVRKTAPTEQDKQSAEALKKEGNTYFGKAKYGAAIEVSIASHQSSQQRPPVGQPSAPTCAACRSIQKHSLYALTGQVWHCLTAQIGSILMQ